MRFKKIYVFILIVASILILSSSAVSAASFGSNDGEVTIDGVDFLLNYTTDIGVHKSEGVYFEVGYDIYGALYEIDNVQTLKYHTQNDSSRGYSVKKLNPYFINGDPYTFIDKKSNNEGYFLIFEKKNKDFIYKICADIPASNETLELMIYSVDLFAYDNDLTVLDLMSIKKCTITTGSDIDDKTKCTVDVGKEFAGENVKISVLYSADDKDLNKGLKVDKKVNDSGKITVYSKDAFEVYPDKAKITIFDSDGKELDTKTVNLVENDKPQSFSF